jgi:DNA-binding FadR family transcriptional regulator
VGGYGIRASYEYHVGQRSSRFHSWNGNGIFHICIAAATHNQAFLQVVMNVQTRLMRYYYQVIVMDSYGSELVTDVTISYERSNQGIQSLRVNGTKNI